MEEVGKEQVMGRLIFHANDNGLYPVSDRSHQKVLIECKLNYKSTSKTEDTVKQRGLRSEAEALQQSPGE